MIPHGQGVSVEHSRHEIGVTLFGSAASGGWLTAPLDAMNPAELFFCIVTVSSVGMLLPIVITRMLRSTVGGDSGPSPSGSWTELSGMPPVE